MMRGDLERELLQELSIGSDLDAEFMKQSAFFATRAFQHARAEDEVRRLEERVELIFARLYAAYRKRHANAKENDCKSFIRRSEIYRRAMEALQRGKLDRDILKAAVKAFEMRRDMLMQLGAARRAEWTSTDMSARTKRASNAVRKTYRSKERRRRDAT